MLAEDGASDSYMGSTLFLPVRGAVVVGDVIIHPWNVKIHTFPVAKTPPFVPSKFGHPSSKSWSLHTSYSSVFIDYILNYSAELIAT